jgi:hypothetical protein
MRPDEPRRRKNLRSISLDIGGVLTGDVWETLVLDDSCGIAVQLNLDRARAAEACGRLWREFCVRDCEEEQYWDAFQRATGKRPTKEQIQLAEAQIWVDSSLGALVSFCKVHSICLSICSETTPFWFEKQKKWLPALNLIDREEQLLSFEEGLYKTGEGRTLFTALAAIHEPTSTIVIDDRPTNLQSAASLGFDIMKYCGPPQDGNAVFTALRRAVD